MVHLRRRYGPGNAQLFLTVLPITPLVDIALVLVVFLIAAPSGTPDRALPVVLPSAASAEPVPRARATVVIDADGTIRIDGRRMDAPGLTAAVRGAGEAVIQADTAVAHGTVVKVVDVLRRAGVDRIHYAAVDGVVDW